MNGTRALKSGTLRVACGPMQTVQANFPAPAGMTVLRLEFTHPDGRNISSANLPVAGVALNPPPVALAAGTSLAAQNEDGTSTLRVFNSSQELRFDTQSGAIRSWRVGNRNLLVGGPVLNLGEAKEGNERDYFRSAKPPVISGAKLSATGSGGLMRIKVTSDVSNGTDNSPLGTLSCTYDITPDAQIRVGWQLDWTAPDARLWEAGLKLSVPADLSKMSWSRDSYFLDYPIGHIGEPTGTAKVGDVQSRASKRELHWMTLASAAGAGLTLLPDQNQPLVARTNPGTNSTTLFASREVAGLRGLSGSWVDNHSINAKKGQTLSGAFILRATGDAR